MSDKRKRAIRQLMADTGLTSTQAMHLNDERHAAAATPRPVRIPWTTIHTRPASLMGDTLHVHPADDMIGHDTSTDEPTCVCAPEVQPVRRDDGSFGWILIHHSLDGREQRES